MDFQSSTSNLWSAGADGTNGFAIFNRTTNANAVTVANGGNVGIGTTNPTVKLHITNSGTVSSIATVRLVGSTGNNAGSQIEFYKAQTPEASIGLASAVTGGLSDDLILLSANPNSIVLSAGASGISVFKADGKVGIGTINPQTLLSLGGLGSTSAASGLTFGGDAQANLYRSAEDTIRTDGSLVVNGNFNTNTTTVTTLNINAGTLPGIPAGSTITGFTYAVNNGNVSQINLVETRFATGSDWTTASTRIQKRTDVTNQAYIEFNPSGASYGMALGVGANSNVEALRILSNGYVGIATTNPAGKLQVVQGDANARYSTFSSVLGLLVKGNDNSAYNLLTLENTQTGTNYGASINFNLGYGGNSAAAGTAILGARIVAAAEQNFTSTASTQDGYLALYTTLDGASSEKVRVRSDGTVGIGTTSTIGKLDVYDNTDGPLLSYVRNLNAGSNAYTAFVLRRDGGNNGIVLFTNSSTRSTDGGTGNSTIRTDYGNLLLGAGGSQHILTTAGNVGIGTTNPTQRLEVQGNAQIGNDSVTNIGLKITRLNGGIRTSEHTYHSSQNSPWYTYGQNLNWTNELAGTVESTQAYRPYFEAFAPAVGYKTFGFMNVTTGAFTNANMVNSLVLKSDGYVGLGTTNPNYQLTVIGANQATADLVDGGNKGGSVLVGSSVNASNQGGAVLFATLNDANTYTPQWAIKSLFLNGQGFGIGDLAFSSRRATGNSNLTESVRFTYDGKVGIGTATPSSPLHVFNTSATLATFTRDLATDAGFAIGADNNGTVLSTIGVHAIQIYTNNTEKARITSDGKLGIGTNTPTTLLSVGGVGSTSAASGITLGGDASANLYRSSTSQIKTDGSFVAGAYILAGTYLQTSNGNIYPGSFTTDLVLNVGNNAGNNWESYPLTIKKGGYVGIGTNTPSGKLHIVSSVAGETVLRADGTNGTLFSVNDDLSDSLMSVNNSAGLPVLEVFADDRVVAGQYGSGDFVLVNNKVGIGTSNPSYKLDVNGSLGVNASTSDTNWPFVVSDNSSAGSRYGLNKVGSMGFNYADAYAQLQLLGANGAYIDFTNSVGGDSNARLIYYAGARLDLTYGFIPKATISITPNAIGIGTTNPLWALDVSGTAVRSFASGTIEPGFIVDYASSNGYGGLFIHTNGVRKWRIGNVGDTDSTSPALYIWQEGVGARMYFRNNGNVGIATTIPIYTLDVSGTIRGERYRGINSLVLNTYTTVNPASNVFLYSQANDRDSWIYLDSADTSSNWGIYHRQIDSAVSNLPANSIGFIGGGTSALQSYISLTNGSAYFAGSVGIGTVSPTNTLQVNGQIAIKGDESADNVKIHIQASDNSNRYTIKTDLDATTTTNDLLIFRSSTVDNMLVLKGNGNVGVGTTNPTHKLEVFNTANSQTYVRINNQNSGTSAYAGVDLQAYGGGWQVRVPASTTFVNPLLFSFNEAERARITSDGKVGIGTTNPVATLDIENPASNLPILNLGGGEAGNAVSDLYVLNSYNNNTGVGFAAKVIGVNISGSLTATNIPVQRTVWGGVTSATAIALGTDGPRAGAQDNAFQIWTTNDGVAGTQLTQKFSVSSAGNVGIGIVTPTDKIQISGGGISFTSSTGLAVPMLGLTALNVAYVGPYNTPTDGNAPSTVLFNHGASVQQTWFYSSGSVAMVLNRQGRLHIGNNNNTPNCLLSVGPSSSTTAVSGMCFGNDAQANLYRSAEDTIKTDGNLVVAGTTSLNGHIYGQKTVALSTASWTTVLTVNMLAHNSCYVKIGAFGDWSNHSAVAFVSELFIQNGDNAGYGEPGTIITAHDNTRGPAGDKIDIQIVDPAAVGTQNFLIQLKLISATSSTNSSLITYHVMGQQASVT